MATKSKKKASASKGAPKKGNGAPKAPPKPKVAAAPAEKDADGLTKADKAQLTRFARDLSNSAIEQYPHLTPQRIRGALRPKSSVRDLILMHSSLVWMEPGFPDAIKSFLASIPLGSRPRLSPEDKAKRKTARMNGILDTAKGSGANAYSIHALKLAYLQNLEPDERSAAKAKFERAVGAVS